MPRRSLAARAANATAASHPRKGILKGVRQMTQKNSALKRLGQFQAIGANRKAAERIYSGAADAQSEGRQGKKGAGS